MNMTRLVHVLPMLVTVAALAYAAYSIQPVVPNRTATAGATTAGKQSPVEGAGRLLTAVGHAEASPAVRPSGRNPFQVVAKPDRVGDDKNSTPEPEKTDSYLAMLEGMTLNATFLQGRTQVAIIDGRIYEPGQNFVGANNEPSPLIVAQVSVNKVIFQAEGKRYFLGYPDQLTSSTASAAAGDAPRTKAAGSRNSARPPVKDSRASPKGKARPRPSQAVVQ